MTDFNDLLTPEAVRCGAHAASRKALLQKLGALTAQAYGFDGDLVAERMLAREKLGSTGFGNGIAIPHCKIEGLRHSVGLFLRLDRPVDFNAVDDMPVDLIFALVSPANSGAAHLKALAKVSRAMRDQEFADKLRGAGSNDALFALLAGLETRDAA
ncbi:PTS IIA-like nitrogen regulatory protein PtsN [Stakelama tenebrarum]|uniref:PTS IIA-like nitrogen regulatory protein PtsN n=1 Tax=Stakelama tenebrarum TaxID=2711215 RepID=A0A6G6Y1P5_9SPHN|nr:PTS IIA-like nitrogen regulatory protein PtsN [Sphingosinithalassobacter tenebrarum]QIG78533.1 PTS IIA-like nitrogen regulatory protein PtsN [Sphingosinithalassobacter tenebrarum]